MTVGSFLCFKTYSLRLMDTEVNSMNCPRCGASGFCGVCNECGFPVTKVKQVKAKRRCDCKNSAREVNRKTRRIVE